MGADFAADQFWVTSPEERVDRCEKMAAVADQLAARAQNEARKEYLELAKQWRTLAAELETWNEVLA